MNLLQHFLVFRCIGCDTALPAGGVICKQCEALLRAECSATCKNCHGKHIECSCFACGRKPPAERVLHMAPYRKEGVVHNMITCCKSTRDKYLLDFMSYMISAEVERKLSPADSTLLVSIPRSRTGRLKNGFDQGKEIGSRVALALGIKYENIIVHKGKKLQKSLGYRQRLHNAKEVFSLRDNAREIVGGKRVILYDDIITTGASATACANILRKAGATGVDIVSFAVTEI